jgi:hypothetical protein
VLSATRESAPPRAPRRTRAPGAAAAGEARSAAWWRRDRAVLPLAWLASAALTGFYLRRGWVPHDEGTLAQSAQRVLAGELPHRDFIDVYTGLLALIDAAGFRLFGATFLVPRVILMGFALAWVPAVFFIARRFCRPWAAGAVTLCAVAWSVPNYTAAMPSWFNLFFATFGVAALIRFAETRRARWLGAAGACGGISILFKIVGLYSVAAGVLALLYLEQQGGPSVSPDETARGGSRGWRALLAGGLGVFSLALLMLVRARLGAAEVLNFVVPGAAVSALIVWNERNAPALPFAARLRRAARLLGPFLAGVLAPVAVFCIPYAASGALGALANGVLVLPFRRLASAAMRPPALGRTLPATLAIAALLLLPLRARVRPLVWGAAAILAAVALARVPAVIPLYQWSFLAGRAVIPAAVVAGCVALARRRDASPEKRGAVLAVLAAAAVCGIVQYPFSAPVYFCFVAPLGLLAAAAALSLNPAPARGAVAVALGYFGLFALLWMNRAYLYSLGLLFLPTNQTVPLDLPIAGGITVVRHQAQDYARFAKALPAHAGGSAWMWAGPDLPEMYPVSGLRNPTRNLFEVFDDPATFEPTLLRTLRARDVHVVVINPEPPFSRPLSPATLAAIEARYPHAQTVGRLVMRWRP